MRFPALTITAAVCGALAVIGGAFAAHGTSPDARALLQTGAQYLMVHALLALFSTLTPGPSRWSRVAGWCAVGGGTIFMAALSAIALLGWSWMGAVAPVGGLLMILAWASIGLAAVGAGRHRTGITPSDRVVP